MNAAKWMRWAIGCLLMVTIVGGVQAASEDIKITVPVETKKDAGIGFNYLTESKVFDLQVDLTSVTKDIDNSKVTDISGRAIWAPKSIEVDSKTHSYEAAGVKPNYGHAARFQGNLVKDVVVVVVGGERTDDPDFRAHLSDVDLDVDSDNDGVAAQNRLPSETDQEDQVEYVTGDAAPSMPMGLRAANNEVIAIKAKLRKKKEGTFDVTAPEVKFYVDAASAAAGNDPTKEVNWSDTGPNGKIGYTKVTDSAPKTITATFTPSEAGGTQGPGSDTTGKSEDRVMTSINWSTAEFSPDPIVTGYSLPAANSTIKRTVTATITPAADAANVKFRVTAGTQNRIKAITVTCRNTTTGEVQFDVFGNDATPSDVPYGDTTLEAYIEGSPDSLLGMVQVIVAIPKTHTRTVGAVTYPANTYTPAGAGCTIGSSGECVVTLLIMDQFGNALTDVYDSGEVREFFCLSQGYTPGWFTYYLNTFGYPIVTPAGDVLTSGQKLDQVGLREKTINLPDSTLTAPQQAGWTAVPPTWGITVGADTLDNTIALSFVLPALEHYALSEALHKITVCAHEVKFIVGNAEYDGAKRTMRTSKANEAAKPVIVTDTAP